MAFQNGNKPIVTNGLVYALDFGNPRSYITGSSKPISLIYDPIPTSINSSIGFPKIDSNGVHFTDKYIYDMYSS